MTPIARALVRAAPERLLWGSDWPHVNMRGRVMPNDGDLLDMMLEWARMKPCETEFLAQMRGAFTTSQSWIDETEVT
ncbi:hypothetical protein EBE87_25505 [Pseudoroseomonas wenyumeiae]|uniref:Amidohydrolase-related domain-containing protein n=1 Tax=Teichococcus wenyumeiae TaxID=2478470 RepID=A0A3A9J6Y2_9PROT|nr:hypothetical protein D6Z83_16905 [Pseudoroseomonas wenyumeiae]RMI15509.1 hypothetical protein EBE87_25505 [Pseudoroseomonas wenyumeiae]